MCVCVCFLLQRTRSHLRFLRKKDLFICLFIFFLAALQGIWDLSSQEGIESMPPALEAWNLNHWTTREVPRSFFKNLFFNTIFKGYTPFIVITKYWLHSAYCTLAFSLSYLYVPLPYPHAGSPPLITTSLFSVYLWVCFFLICVCVCEYIDVYI